MEEFIARTNLQYFRDLLKTERDEAKRRIILKLIAEQEIKLAGLSHQRSEDTPTSSGANNRMS